MGYTSFMPDELLGIFGGTFDPPHIAHLVLAEEARRQLGLNRLLWVLTPEPPHKQGRPVTPLTQRLAMLSLALAGSPDFELSTLEIERPGPHYTVDTLGLLAERHPGAGLVYLMGADALAGLPDWRRPADLLNACHALGVMRRPGQSPDLKELEMRLPGLRGKVRFIDAPLLDISAAEIRRRAGAGEPFRYFVLPDVYDYIQSEGLYRP
jgi:nicotinate-nucleotide adenylyltransferase